MEFLDKVLVRKGFGSMWRLQIKECFSSIHLSLVMNDQPRLHSRRAGGLSTGTHIHLFFLLLQWTCRVAEKDDQIVERQGLIDGYEVGRDEVRVSHLKFANILFYFCLSLLEVLRIYCPFFNFFWQFQVRRLILQSAA